jgi:hypothetical protein
MRRFLSVGMVIIAGLALAACQTPVGNPNTNVGVQTGNTNASQTQTNEQTQNTDVDVSQNVTVAGQDLPTAVVHVNPETGERGGEVTLDGSESTPGTGGGSLSYIWSLTTEYEDLAIQSAQSAVATLKIPVEIPDGAQIVVRLTVLAGGRSNEAMATIPVSGGLENTTCAGNDECDDGRFCNGPEACVDGQCQHGRPPCPSRECDEAAGQCTAVGSCASDADCDDGLFCNGFETCAGATCLPGDPPCGSGQVCLEDTGECVEPGGTGLPEDSCLTPYAVCTGFFYTGTTARATVDGADTCGGTGPDVWLLYTPLVDGVLSISMCGSSFDTVISVHIGCEMASQIPFACNDDDPSGTCGTASAGWIDVYAFTQYRIRISGFGSDTAGDFRIELSGPPGVGCGG